MTWVGEFHAIDFPRTVVRAGGNPVPSESLRGNLFLDSRLRPPWMEVMLGMQEQFPVQRDDELPYLIQIPFVFVFSRNRRSAITSH